jgi:hypothetical protein
VTKDEHIKLTLDALSATIVATLAGEDRGRFASAQRLCGIANAIQRETARRAKDLGPQAGAGMGFYGARIGLGGGLYDVAGGGGGGEFPEEPAPVDDGAAAPIYAAMAMQNPHLMGGGARAQEMVTHELLAKVGPFVERQMKQADAVTARNQAEELSTLMDLPIAPGEPGAEKIQARIAQIQNQIEERTKTHATPVPAVVPPELLRGHQAGESGTGAHLPRLREPHADGGGGDAQAAPAGAGRLGPQALVRRGEVP